MRIVSLLSSATETLFALGCDVDLVGRSHECDFPPAAHHLPACSRSRVSGLSPSAVITQEVADILAQALSIYEVLPEQLAALQPDVIVTQTQCQVCAVSLDDVHRALREVTGSRPEIVAVCPNSLDEIYDDILRIAGAVGRDAAGQELVQQMKDTYAATIAKARALGQRPRVATLEWFSPLMAAGNWIPQFIEDIGAVNLFGVKNQHSPWLNIHEFLASDPDVILGFPCGFDLERTVSERQALLELPGWQDLRAVKSGRVFYFDGNRFFNRPGPRIVESVEMMCEVLYPDAFEPRHHRYAWVSDAECDGPR